jgi:hypothetical protein
MNPVPTLKQYFLFELEIVRYRHIFWGFDDFEIIALIVNIVFRTLC